MAPRIRGARTSGLQTLVVSRQISQLHAAQPRCGPRARPCAGTRATRRSRPADAPIATPSRSRAGLGQLTATSHVITGEHIQRQEAIAVRSSRERSAPSLMTVASSHQIGGVDVENHLQPASPRRKPMKISISRSREPHTPRDPALARDARHPHQPAPGRLTRARSTPLGHRPAWQGHGAAQRLIVEIHRSRSAIAEYPQAK